MARKIGKLPKMPRVRNPVAKNAHKVNRAVIIPAKKGAGTVYKRARGPVDLTGEDS